LTDKRYHKGHAANNQKTSEEINTPRLRRPTIFFVTQIIILTKLCRNMFSVSAKEERRRKWIRLYWSTLHSRRSGTDHTVLPANYTIPASTS